ncbi:MAG: aldehyde dehydrogenase family protein, partial [Solirubrobacteraceae bacterium]
LCLMTRNAVVVSPHPMARRVCAQAAWLIADAAVAAGAPDGCVQVVEEPTIPLIEALMADPGTDLILATGGNAVVRAAYSSGTPSLGVGPGNVPVLIDASADVAHAAACLVESKSFDNSILCTNESTAIVEEAVAERFVAELRRNGAYVLEGEEIDRMRAACYPDGRLQTKLAGKSALELASAAGVRAPSSTRILVAPFAMIVPEEPLAQEKLFPLLGLVRAPDARRGIDAARALVRIGGGGHSAVIHSQTRETILAFGAALRVLRITVNAGGSTGNSGLDTHLPLTMTIGTGFFGGSSLTENLQPRDLVQWTSVAYASDLQVPFDDFTGLEPWSAQAAPPPSPRQAPEPALAVPSVDDLRQLIRDELRELVRG